MQNNTCDNQSILKTVDAYYTDKINTFGPTHQGVDWSTEESQILRFTQLLKVCDASSGATLNDYGCGYGALFGYIQKQKMNISYFGFDISKDMLGAARKLHGDHTQCHFVDTPGALLQSDYTVASGIFNVKLNTHNDAWKPYTITLIEQLNDVSSKGFAFNMLTAYSDKEKMRTDLYYADPCFYFDLCKRRFSRHVSLLHDYGLYEFTVIVRK